MQNKYKGFLIAFTIGLLIITNLVRSNVLVDRSFLPRFFAFTTVLLIICIFTFRKKIYPGDVLFAGAFILFYLWSLLSCFWAISPSESIIQSQLIFLCLVLFLVVSSILKEYPAFENIFIKTHFFALLFSFGLGFYRIFNMDFYDPYRIISISANNNLYSGFLLLSLPLILTGYSIFKGFWKYLSVIVAVFSLFFIIIIQSRAGYLGLFLAILISLLLVIFKTRSVFSKRNILTWLVAGCMLISGVFIFYSSLDNTRKAYFLSKVPVWNYFKSYQNATPERILEKEAVKAKNDQTGVFDFSEDYYENANLRIIFWKKSLCLFKKHPLAGVGAGNWRIAVPSCEEPANPDHTLKNYTYSQPHNEWISIISELGIIGFILSIFIFFIPLSFVFYRIIFSFPKPPVTAIFYASFITGFYLFSCFDFPMKRIEHNVLLFSIFAFLFSGNWVKPSGLTTGNIEKVPGIQRKKLYDLCEPFVSFVLKKIPVILILIFTLLLVSARIKGEYYTVKMFRNERKDDVKVIEYCRKAENPFYRITPNTLPIAWFEGVAKYRLGDIDSADQCFLRALKFTPFEVRVLNDHGISLFKLNQTNEAKKVLLYTLQLDPWFDDAKFNLAAIYYLTGQSDSALIYIGKCRNSQKKTDFLEELKRNSGEVNKSE